MTLDAFKRLAKSVLAHLGEDALLRGAAPSHKVHVERDVQMVDRQGNVYVAQFIATINVEDQPVPGDALVIGHYDTSQVFVADETFVLETMIDTTGYVTRFTARKTA